MNPLAELDALDDEGEVDGYLVGRSLRLADWRAKKEAERYEALFNRLRVLAWQRKVRAEGGEPLERLRARQRAYAARPEVKLRANELARLRRRARYCADPTVCSCLECGAVWCRVFGARGPTPHFCGDACRQRHRYQERTPGARRIRRRGTAT